MKFKYLTTITASIMLFVGIIFLMRPGVMFELHAIDNKNVTDEFLMTFWKLKGLAQMFGAMLMGVGVIALSVRNLRDRALQQKIATGFFFALLLAGLTSWGGHSVYWKTAFTATFTSLFFILTAGYAWLIFFPEGFVYDGVFTPEILRERWSRQIGEAAAQQERNRLARDLHDSIKQQIFSINVSAATAQARFETDPVGAKTAIADVRTSARDALAEMEAMLQNLRPVPLETVGLIEALRKQGEALQYRTGANVITEFGELPDAKHLPLGAQENLFRIAQEALSNIARHARAQNITLRIGTEADEESFSLTINDDGQGFDALTKQAGMGMKNMHSRAREMNGNLLVESLPRQGTRLHLSLPLCNAERDHLKFLFRLAAFGGIAGMLLIGSWRELPPSTYTWLLPIWLTLWIGGATALVVGRFAWTGFKAKEPTNAVLELERYFSQLILFFFVAGYWAQHAFIRPPTGSAQWTSLFMPTAIVAGCFYSFVSELKKEFRALSLPQATHRVRSFERHVIGVCVVSVALLVVLAKLNLRPSLLAMAMAITAYVLTLLWFRYRVLKGKPL